MARFACQVARKWLIQADLRPVIWTPAVCGIATRRPFVGRNRGVRTPIWRWICHIKIIKITMMLRRDDPRGVAAPYGSNGLSVLVQQ
jgi:hypothetical protein